MKCQAGRSLNKNQDCLEKYQWPHIYTWHHIYDRKWRITKEPADEKKEEREKPGSNLYIEKMTIMVSGPITSRQIGKTWGKMETVIDCIFSGSKITAEGDCSHERKKKKKVLDTWKKICNRLKSTFKSRGITLQLWESWSIQEVSIE